MLEGLQVEAKAGRQESVGSSQVTTQREVSLAIDLRNHQIMSTSISNSQY